MLPSRHFGNLRPESWVGILDGTYAIILTLMVFQLPALVTGLIDHFQMHHDAVLLLIRLLCIHVLGYVAMFMIIYEVWAIHRAILTISEPSRHKTIFTGAILAVSSFMPPLVQMANTFRQAYALSGDRAGSVVVDVIRALFYLLLLLIYFLLHLSAKRSLLRSEDGGSIAAEEDLVSLVAVARSRCILAVAVYLASLVFRGGLIYLVVFAFLSYFGVDFLDFGRRRLRPLRWPR